MSSLELHLLETRKNKDNDMHLDSGSKELRSSSPTPSCVSMRSNESMKFPPNFSSEPNPSAAQNNKRHRSPSPTPSCVSMRSNESMKFPPNFSSEPDPSAAQKNNKRHRSSSPTPSCVSMRSNESMKFPPNFSSEPNPSAAQKNNKRHRSSSPTPSCVSMRSNESMKFPPNFSSEPDPSAAQSREHRSPSSTPSCVSMSSNKSIDYPPNFNSETGPSALQQSYQPSCGRLDEVKQRNQVCSPDGKTCGAQPPSQPPQKDAEVQRAIENHKACLNTKFKNISEGVIKAGANTLLNDIYTKLYITEGESAGVNKEHEVWQMEMVCRENTTEDPQIDCNDIFKPLPGQEKPIRNVITKGVAGIGKTVSVQKFILDWTEGVANQNVDFIFPLPFRALNLVRQDQYSLLSLLLGFHPELCDKMEDVLNKCGQVVFIFDGLDESRIALNFQQEVFVSDVNQISSLDVLITSLIQGTLLPSALIWITSRPAAVTQIPAKYISKTTEVRGFTDQQKEEYFKKRISDESLSSRVISHIKDSRSLHIMCYIPVFSWIAATVLQYMLQQARTQEIPKTLTEMFIQFLHTQAAMKDQKYQGGIGMDSDQLLESQKEVILKLAELAFKNLRKGNIMFYEEDLQECGIDVNEASVYSGLCTKIFQEESVFQQRKVYCFVHLSIQEFLAALHVFVSYVYQMELMGAFFCLKVSLKAAVKMVLESKNGQFDLFLRFLMGICLDKNQRLLKGLLKPTPSTSKSISEICQYIGKLNKEDLCPDRCISLLQCLSEVADDSLHKQIRQYVNSPNGSKGKLSPVQCSAMGHMLIMADEVLDEFDLKNYNTSDEGRRRLLPVLKSCRKAELCGCKLNRMACETVRKCLQCPNYLVQLDLSHSGLGDSGVQLLAAGLTSPHCKLQILRLTDCAITHKSCGTIAAVLHSSNSLTELDLSHNDLGNCGIELLFKEPSSAYCKLQTLRLSGCCISTEGCGFLVAALTSNLSHLEELDLSYNHPGEQGLDLLSDRQKDPDCNLKRVNTDHCSEIRCRPGVSKYALELTMDPQSAHRNLCLSEEKKKVTFLREEQPYPECPERFDWSSQVLCRESLSGRCYWEVEWSGDWVYIAVSYKTISRKGGSDGCRLGRNDKSWSLWCSPDRFRACHEKKHADIPAPSTDSRRVGVYLDWPAGILSFYSVSSDTLSHLHTFKSKFTEPLYAAFWVQDLNSSVSLL